jgi:hypothetical protein
VDDLVAFLRARLDEDERVARAAAGHHVFDGTGIVVEHYATGTRSSGVPSHVARQLARWDPARVLAEVEAKRQLVNFFARMPEMSYDSAEWGLMLLALPYVGHPDYQQEWRPSPTG